MIKEVIPLGFGWAQETDSMEEENSKQFINNDIQTRERLRPHTEYPIFITSGSWLFKGKRCNGGGSLITVCE